METEKRFFLAKLKPYKTRLEAATTKQKEGFVTIQLGEQFNSLLDDARRLYPDRAEHFPKALTVSAFGTSYCERYLDLQIVVDQVLEIIGVEH